jgi:hypothetical protein
LQSSFGCLTLQVASERFFLRNFAIGEQRQEAIPRGLRLDSGSSSTWQTGVLAI